MPDLNRITLVIESLPDGHAQVHVDIPSPRPGMRLETAAHALAIDAVGWLGKQPAVVGFLYGQKQSLPRCLDCGVSGTDRCCCPDSPFNLPHSKERDAAIAAMPKR